MDVGIKISVVSKATATVESTKFICTSVAGTHPVMIKGPLPSPDVFIAIFLTRQDFISFSTL